MSIGRGGIDVSFDHAKAAANATLIAAHYDFIIVYFGAPDNTKNCTQTELQALLTAGLQVGAVYENTGIDLVIPGQGTAQAQHLAVGCNAAGYDIAHCVGFTGYDTNATPVDYPGIVREMNSFDAVINQGGYYGDSDSIDAQFNSGATNRIYWQSDSASFSPKNPTPNAHIWQQFNALPVALPFAADYNLLLKPVPFMKGAPVTNPLTAQDVWNLNITGSPLTPADPQPPTQSAANWMVHTNSRVYAIEQAVNQITAALPTAKGELDAIKNQLNTIQQAITNLTAMVARIGPSGGPAPNYTSSGPIVLTPVPPTT